MNNKEYIARRLVDPEGESTVWGLSIMQAYAAVAQLAFMPMLGRYRTSDWLVLGARIFNQLDAKLQCRTHLAMTARDVFRCNSWPQSFSYDLKSYADLNYFLRHDDEFRYDNCLRRVARVLQRTEAKLVIANSTIDPINRLWLQSAKSAGLKTFCVQHGVYSRMVPSYVLEEDIIDRYISLDRYQSSIISRNIPVHKIDILGVEERFDWSPPEGPLKVCFVGEDTERYGFEELKTSMILTYKSIMLSPQAKVWGKFYYKPHPSERMILDVMDFASPLKAREINLPDVYIGFSSTFLKEMSSKGKLAIQILDARTQAENFQQMGYCLSLPNDDHLPEALGDLLSSRQQVPFIKNAELSEILRNHG